MNIHKKDNLMYIYIYISTILPDKIIVILYIYIYSQAIISQFYYKIIHNLI